jgi:MFS family permease
MAQHAASEHMLSSTELDRIYRRTFIYFLWDFVVFGVAISLIGASTVIPDFVRKLTDQEVVIALSGQMFEVGWLLPQLLVARYLMGVANKKWWFVAPNIPVRTFILIFGVLVAVLGPGRPTAILLAFLLLYGLAGIGDGLVGLPWVDLMGSSLDDKRRSRLFGLGNALIGVLMLGLAPLVGVILGDSGPDFPNNYALLFGVSGLLFFITLPMMMFIHELPGGKPSDTIPTLREYLPDLGRVLRDDGPFRAVIIARVLMAFFTLAAPFYVGFATEQIGVSSNAAVSRLMLMQTLGSVAGSLLFSRYGDRRSLEFIRGSLAIGLLLPILALVASVAGPAPLYVGFLASGVMNGCLMFSFLNWIIAYTTAEQRPVYSGLFNSVSAVGLLVAPLTGGVVVQNLGYEAAFVVALVMIVAALYVALRYIVAPPSERRVRDSG